MACPRPQSDPVGKDTPRVLSTRPLSCLGPGLCQGGFSIRSQMGSWPNSGRQGPGARGGRNAISRLAIWLGGRRRVSSHWPLLPPGPGGPCVERDRLPDGQALALVWVGASELPVVRANQLSDVAVQAWRGHREQSQAPQRAERQKIGKGAEIPAQLRAGLPR